MRTTPKYRKPWMEAEDVPIGVILERVSLTTMSCSKCMPLGTSREGS